MPNLKKIQVGIRKLTTFRNRNLYLPRTICPISHVWYVMHVHHPLSHVASLSRDRGHAGPGVLRRATEWVRTYQACLRSCAGIVADGWCPLGTAHAGFAFTHFRNPQLAPLPPTSPAGMSTRNASNAKELSEGLDMWAPRRVSIAKRATSRPTPAVKYPSKLFVHCAEAEKGPNGAEVDLYGWAQRGMGAHPRLLLATRTCTSARHHPLTPSCLSRPAPALTVRAGRRTEFLVKWFEVQHPHGEATASVRLHSKCWETLRPVDLEKKDAKYRSIDPPPPWAGSVPLTVDA